MKDFNNILLRSYYFKINNLKSDFYLILFREKGKLTVQRIKIIVPQIQILSIRHKRLEINLIIMASVISRSNELYYYNRIVII